MVNPRSMSVEQMNEYLKSLTGENIQDYQAQPKTYQRKLGGSEKRNKGFQGNSDEALQALRLNAMADRIEKNYLGRKMTDLEFKKFLQAASDLQPEISESIPRVEQKTKQFYDPALLKDKQINYRYEPGVKQRDAYKAQISEKDYLRVKYIEQLDAIEEQMGKELTDAEIDTITRDLERARLEKLKASNPEPTEELEFNRWNKNLEPEKPRLGSGAIDEASALERGMTPVEQHELAKEIRGSSSGPARPYSYDELYPPKYTEGGRIRQDMANSAIQARTPNPLGSLDEALTQVVNPESVRPQIGTSLEKPIGKLPEFIVRMQGQSGFDKGRGPGSWLPIEEGVRNTPGKPDMQRELTQVEPQPSELARERQYRTNPEAFARNYPVEEMGNLLGETEKVAPIKEGLAQLASKLNSIKKFEALSKEVPETLAKQRVRGGGLKKLGINPAGLLGFVGTLLGSGLLQPAAIGTEHPDWDWKQIINGVMNEMQGVPAEGQEAII